MYLPSTSSSRETREEESRGLIQMWNFLLVLFCSLPIGVATDFSDTITEWISGTWLDANKPDNKSSPIDEASEITNITNRTDLFHSRQFIIRIWVGFCPAWCRGEGGRIYHDEKSKDFLLPF